MVMVKGIVGGRGENPAKQSPEAGMRAGALPEHPQQEGAEQRRVKKREEKLDVIHQVIEPQDDEGGSDSHRNSENRCEAAHLQIMIVRLARVHVRLVDVESPDGVEGRNV